MDDNKEGEFVELLFRIRNGDQAAFARLYQGTSPILFAVCLRLLPQRELAEEALQEAYVKIWHSAGEYNAARGGVMTWMTSIVRYQAIDLYRQRARRPEAPLTEARLESIDDDLAGPMQISMADDDAAALDRCLRLLSEAQQRCLRLAFFQGMTHHQMSQRLERPLGTVKSWIRRGLQELKQCLRP